MLKTKNPIDTDDKNSLNSRDIAVIKQFADYLEKIKFDKYLERHSNTRKMLWNSMLGGIAHGFGYIIGATIFIAYFWVVIEWLGGLPWIGKIIARIVEIVLSHQSTG